MPVVIIVAGPNGAGKTSFVNEALRSFKPAFTYINADEIEKRLPLAETKLQRELAAGRLMIEAMDNAISKDADLIVETTLATRHYARRIVAWRELGYSIGLIYLQLPSVEHSIARVRRRVAAGGHDIPEQIIRRRFEASRLYLDTIYKPIVDEWYMWESREGRFVPMAAWDDK